MPRVGVDQHHQIIRISRVLNIGVLSPSRGGNRLFQHTVYLSEIDVAEYWRDHPALGNSFCPGRLQDHLQELRSEEHTSELQSRLHLVCRLLLEKKKTEHCNDFQPQSSKSAHRPAAESLVVDEYKAPATWHMCSDIPYTCVPRMNLIATTSAPG